MVTCHWSLDVIGHWPLVIITVIITSVMVSHLAVMVIVRSGHVITVIIGQVIVIRSDVIAITSSSFTIITVNHHLAGHCHRHYRHYRRSSSGLAGWSSDDHGRHRHRHHVITVTSMSSVINTVIPSSGHRHVIIGQSSIPSTSYRHHWLADVIIITVRYRTGRHPTNAMFIISQSSSRHRHYRHRQVIHRHRHHQRHRYHCWPSSSSGCQYWSSSSSRQLAVIVIITGRPATLHTVIRRHRHRSSVTGRHCHVILTYHHQNTDVTITITDRQILHRPTSPTSPATGQPG